MKIKTDWKFLDCDIYLDVPGDSEEEAKQAVTLFNDHMKDEEKEKLQLMKERSEAVMREFDLASRS